MRRQFGIPRRSPAPEPVPPSQAAGGSTAPRLRPVVAASTENPQLYQMAFTNRAAIWAPRVFLAASVCAGLFWIIRPGEPFPLRVMGVFVSILAVLVLWLSSRQMRPLVVGVRMEASDLHFRRWDGRVITIPRRGRALRKDTRRSNQMMHILQLTDSPDIIALLRQDKQATAMMEDLERRGVIRGAARAERRPNPMVPR